MADGERCIAVRGDQFEPATGQFFRDFPRQVLPRQAEQLFPFSRYARISLV